MFSYLFLFISVSRFGINYRFHQYSGFLCYLFQAINGLKNVDSTAMLQFLQSILNMLLQLIGDGGETLQVSFFFLSLKAGKIFKNIHKQFLNYRVVFGL